MVNGFVDGHSNGQLAQDGKSALQLEQERLQKALARKIAEEAQERGTQRLPGRTLDSIKPETLFASSFRYGSAGDYSVLPLRLVEKLNLESTLRWRIELHGLDGSAGPIGLDLIGDVVVGRGKDGPAAPDVDLDPFSAQKMGVSRRHVILRPTEKHLYLIDLNSTNGTMHNGVPLGPGVARPLEHNDTIMIGDLTFTLKIIGRPNGSSSQPAQESMRVVELLNRENARKAADAGTTSQDVTRRMLQEFPPAAKITNSSSNELTGNALPRAVRTTAAPQPAAAQADSQPEKVQQPETTGLPGLSSPQDAKLVQISPPKPEQPAGGSIQSSEPAKPAKIMDLRARLGLAGSAKK